MLSRIIRTKNALYFKEGGWSFRKPLVQNWDFSPSPSKSIVQNLIQLNQFCEQNKIKLYVLEVPRKEHFYKDVYINKFGFDEKKFFRISQAQESIRNEVRKYHIPYVYPYKALLNAAKRDFVFFKWSHHWTDWGAFVGYCELMKEVRRDFPDMPIVSLNDYQKSQNRFIRDEWHRNYWLGFTERFFNFSDDSLNRSLYSYYDHRDGDKMTLKVGKYTKDFSYPEGRYKIMLMGRSHNDNLTQFLPYSAAQTRYIRLNMGQTKDSDLWKILKLYRNDILSFKPDILILSMSTEALPKLRDICSTK